MNDKIINDIAIDLSNSLIDFNNFLIDVLDLQKHRIVKRKIRFKKKIKYQYMISNNRVANMIPVKQIFDMEVMAMSLIRS